MYYMEEKEIQKRVRRAEELFVAGFNCAQAVVAAYADLYGYTEEQALKVSAGFGGGIGRLRLTCGAACGMVILEGMRNGNTSAKDRESKSANYQAVQQLLDTFKKEYGSITCADLLKLKANTPLSFIASERTEEYYKTRPCLNQVVAAARIYGNSLD